MQPNPPRRNLPDLIYRLCSQDFCLVFGLVAGFHARAYLKRLVAHRGDFQPIRLLFIYSLTLPLVLLLYLPSPCDPTPNLLEAWSLSLGAAFGFYRLLP